MNDIIATRDYFREQGCRAFHAGLSRDAHNMNWHAAALMEWHAGWDLCAMVKARLEQYRKREAA